MVRRSYGLPAVPVAFGILIAAPVVAFSFLYFYSGFGTFTAQNGLPGPRPGDFTMALAVIGLVAFGVEALFGRLKLYPLPILGMALAYSALVWWSSRTFPTSDPIWTIKRLGFGLTLFGLIFLVGLVPRFRTVAFLARVTVIVCCAMNVIDYFLGDFLPFTFSLNWDRAAGFFGNANNAAMRIAFMLPLAAFGVSWRSRLALYAVVFVGIFLTFSRSGFLLFAVAVLVTEAFIVPKGPVGRRAMVISIASLASMGVFYVVWPFITSAISDLLAGYLNDNTVARLSGDVTDAATMERLWAAKVAWQTFLFNPTFGAGIGTTNFIELGGSAHNMVLQIMSEMGLVGLAWLVAFLAAIWFSGPRFGPVCVILWLASAPFSHNLLDDPGMALLVAPYVVAATYRRAEGAREEQRRLTTYRASPYPKNSQLPTIFSR